MIHKPYIFSKKAAQDITDILDYSFKQFGEHQTQVYKNDLHSALLTLSANPQIGRDCSAIKPDYRCYRFQSHLIFYKLRETDIYIIRILHKSRDVQNHL